MPHDAGFAGERFVRALRSFGRRRIRLPELRDLFARACPELAEQPDQRLRLAALIGEAAGQGALTLPKGRHAWD